MYATPHTLAGFTIVKAFEDNLAVGIPLAIISHFALDYINERGLSKEDRFTFDLIPSLFCYAVALFTGNFWIFLLGSVAGNLPDLIDKKLYLSIFIPSRFKSTNYLHWQKPLLDPHPNVTKAIGPLSQLIITIILLMF